MGKALHPSFHQDEDDCELTVFQKIGLTGEVTITPKVECGPVSITCVTGEIIHAGEFGERCLPEPSGDGRCRVVFFQELCVEVPVRFRAKANCDLTGVFCGPASTDPRHCLGDESESDSSSDSSSGTSSSSSAGASSESSGDDSDPTWHVY